MDERIELLITRLEKIQTENTFLNHLLDEAEDHVLPTPKPTIEIIKQLACRFYSMEKNME